MLYIRDMAPSALRLRLMKINDAERGERRGVRKEGRPVRKCALNVITGCVHDMTAAILFIRDPANLLSGLRAGNGRFESRLGYRYPR